MKTLVVIILFPAFIALCLICLCLFIVGAALFGPLLSMAGIAELPAKFYDYAK